jgi:hypothetical protein
MQIWSADIYSSKSGWYKRVGVFSTKREAYLSGLQEEFKLNRGGGGGGSSREYRKAVTDALHADYNDEEGGEEVKAKLCCLSKARDDASLEYDLRVCPVSHPAYATAKARARHVVYPV